MTTQKPISNLIHKRHMMYLAQEVILPLVPAVAIRFPGDSGSGIREGVAIFGECELSMVNSIRERITASGRGEVCTTWTLDFTIAADHFVNLIEYLDIVTKRIEDVCMHSYTLLGDYSDYEDEADPERRWNLLYNGLQVNMAPSSRKDTSWSARDIRRDDGSDLRRKQEFTVTVTMK